MAANQPFYNSNYNDPYYTRYDTLDGVLEQQQIQQQQQQAAQQGGGIGGSAGALAGQYAGRKASEYAANQLGTSAASEGAAPTVAGAESSVSTIGVPAAVAIATVLGGRSGLRMLQGKQKNWKDASLADNAGRATLAIATGGLSEIGNKFFGGHQSTRQVAGRNTKSLMSQAPDDQKWQNYVAGMREQYNSAPTDPSKPFAGKYGSWDEYEKAGLEAADLTGVVGNLKAYGPQYAGLSFDQQKALTQKNIDAGNYSSKKGEVNINDEAKAKSFLDELLKANQK